MLFPTEQHLQSFQMDKFGYKELSRKILDEIVLKMELPNCFGLYGNWGSGKSTMVHFMMKHLEGKQKKYTDVTKVYFEPWKYEYSDKKDLLFALLNCLKKTFDIDSKIWKKIMTDAVVIASGLLRASTTIDVNNTAQDFKLVEKHIFKEHETWIDKIEEFKTTFGETIKNGLKKKETSKLIIFIDDLDRCLPENAVKLLEGIKNLLAVDNTLFVLAIDKRIISEMIERKYGLYQDYGEEYLMKIIHYYYELPKIRLQQIVKEIIDSYSLKYTERQIAYITEFLQSFGKEPRVAKHFLHQFGMKIYLSEEAKGRLGKDETEKQLQYIFVASFLLIKFPKLFSLIDPKERLERLINIRDSASMSKNNNPDKYKHVIDKDSLISPKDRRRLESIMQYGINKGNESAPEQIIDVDLLQTAMEMIKKY